MKQAITKQKIFDMPAMSAAEAADTLTFIDHPFYVFRNEVSQWVYRCTCLPCSSIIYYGICSVCTCVYMLIC